MKNAAEDTFFKTKKLIRINGGFLDFSTPGIMGILNLTPDSFYDGGKYQEEVTSLKHAEQMLSDGAALLDLGAQSTRPGAQTVSAGDEWKRLERPLKTIRKEFPGAVISVDTFYAEVASRAVDCGANVINDISGGTFDDNMFHAVAALGVPYILMHIRGTPATMQRQPVYENVTAEILKHFSERIARLVSLGVTDILIDPGFGFGKTIEHNFTLLQQLEIFKIAERPVVAGLSRKSMIIKTLNTTARETLNGTTVLNTIALLKGVSILRVHDVKEAVEAIKLVTCMRS